MVPDVAKPLIYRIPFKATIHQPIITKGMTMADLERLKEMTFQVMNEGLGNAAIKSEKNQLITAEILLQA